MTATIKVVVNGEAREIPAGLTVTALLGHLRMGTDRVAVERNLEILPRARWNDTTVETGDCFEIVHFVGGGESGPDPSRRTTPLFGSHYPAKYGDRSPVST